MEDFTLVRIWNYLRVRGEYSAMKFVASPTRELPPRARRIPAPCGAWSLPRGTTSACAENTGHHHRHHPRHRNYLRVRGEYIVNS